MDYRLSKIAKEEKRGYTREILLDCWISDVTLYRPVWGLRPPPTYMGHQVKSNLFKYYVDITWCVNDVEV